MKDKDAQLMMEAWDVARRDEAGGSSDTAEVLAQLKADIDEFLSSGEANNFGAEGIKEAILDMIDQASRFGAAQTGAPDAPTAADRYKAFQKEYPGAPVHPKYKNT